MQVLDTGFQPFSNEEGNFIRTHLIDTRMNERNWRTKPPIEKLTTILNREVPGKHFMIDGEKIKQGVDAHYYGDGTKQSITSGYEQYSHGIYEKVLGPFPYDDGTDDYYYDSIIKLHNSKAAAALIENGSNTAIPFAHSAHIWPLEGPDDNITDFEFLGGALVVKGAYGENAVISKMCKGTAPVCTKSLSAADQKTADIITSLVTKTASTQHNIMSENKDVTTQVTNAPIKTETPKVETITAQTQITNAPRFVTPEEYAESEKRNKDLEKQVTQLVNEAKLNTLNNMFGKVKDEKIKKELLEEFSKLEKRDVDLINEKLTRLYPILKAAESEEEEKPAEEDTKKKGKAASTELPKEPAVPTEESKAASAPVNKIALMHRFITNGGKL